jgi:hypothetical protein
MHFNCGNPIVNFNFQYFFLIWFLHIVTMLVHTEGKMVLYGGEDGHGRKKPFPVSRPQERGKSTCRCWEHGLHSAPQAVHSICSIRVFDFLPVWTSRTTYSPLCGIMFEKASTPKVWLK